MTNRQKALEWFRKRIQSIPMPGAKAMYEEAIKALEKPEIVQCKDCRFWDEKEFICSCDYWYTEVLTGDVEYVDIRPYRDFHCGYAERRANE